MDAGSADAGAVDSATGDATTSDGAACDRHLPACPSPPPSYAQTVAPILQARCATCHYAGSTITRTDLSTYDQAHANRGSMLTQVYGCLMPPADARNLAADERASLLAWLVCGAPNN